jgi:hypothetical protein
MGTAPQVPPGWDAAWDEFEMESKGRIPPPLNSGRMSPRQREYAEHIRRMQEHERLEKEAKEQQK